MARPRSDRRGRRVRLMAIAALASVTAAAAQGAPPRLGHQGRWLTDPQGRVVMLRGGNMDQTIGNPGIADGGTGRDRWNDATPRLFAKAGFNAIRLVVLMSRLTPSPGQLDQGYIEAIARTVAAYNAEGVYVLVDFHQDEYGPSVGIRGMPAWMTLTGGIARDPKLQFPNGYFRDPAVRTAFDNFWADKPVAGGEGVQEAYLSVVRRVAERFAEDPGVFGVDLMNEPSPGTPCSLPTPRWTGCEAVERDRLGPFYAKAGAIFANAAPKTLLFVEPFMLQGAVGVPINTPSPGSAERGLSFHDYGPFRETRRKVIANALASATTSGSTILNTEWGNSNDPATIVDQAEDFDAKLIPWIAWARGPFEALVNPAATQNLQIGGDTPPKDPAPVLRAYARPYPAATAGTPLSLRFDADTGVLDYSWSTEGPDGEDRGGLSTEVRMPAASFPHGYRVSVIGGHVVSRPGAPRLVVRATPGTRQVTLHAVALGPVTRLTHTSAPVAGRYSLDTNLADLLRDPAARAIVLRNLPSLGAPDALAMAPQAPLRAFQGALPEFSDAMAERIDAELAALPAPNTSMPPQDRTPR